MIGRIAIRPAGRWRRWHPLAEGWRTRTWWRLVALARHGEDAPLDPATGLPERRAVRRERDAAPDPRAVVDALYQQHARAVLAYLAVRLPTLADAEDALGEVFISALQASATGATPDLPWLLLVARRRAADFYRARVRGARLAGAATEDAPDPHPQPEELSLRAEERRELRALLATLPDEQREALALRFTGGLRAPEIGAVLGKSGDAVRALLSRAVRRLRQEWRQEEIG